MDAWEITTLIIAEVLITLASFSAIIALIVFSIRKPIRRHKPIEMRIFDKIKPHVNAVNNRIMLFITFLGKHQFLIPANLILIFYLDRKSTRLNSSHSQISYAVFCLKK